MNQDSGVWDLLEGCGRRDRGIHQMPSGCPRPKYIVYEFAFFVNEIKMVMVEREVERQ
jgi:hypothetical protein